MRNATGLLAAVLLAAGTTALPGAVDADDFVEIEENATELLTILESLPYASEGIGPVVYMFEYSECPYCQRMYRDFQGQDLGLEFRRYFVPVTARSARETAALGKSRDPQDYHSFMTGRKAAPAIEYDNEAIEIHNAMITAASEEIPPLLIRNGWSARGLVFPAYFWLEGGKVFAQGGYLKDNFEKAMNRARAGWNAESEALLASVGGASAEGITEAQPVAPTDGTTISDAGGYDIVGLRLGMTREAVLAVIRAHNPQLRITEVTNPVIMRDSRGVGVEMFEFMSEIVAYWGPAIPEFKDGRETSETITVAFAGPPSASEAILISRNIQYVSGQAPAFTVVRQALLEKYGAPVHDGAPNNNRLFTALWHQGETAASERELGVYMGHFTKGPTIKNHGGNYNHAPTQIKGLPQPQPDIGPIVFATVNTLGPGVNALYTTLCDSPKRIRAAKMATSQMAEAALARHEQELLGQARQQQGPKL